MPDSNIPVVPIAPVVPVEPTPQVPAVAVASVAPVVLEPVVPQAPVAPTIPEPVIAKPVATGNAYFDSVQEALYAQGIDHTKYSDEIATHGEVTAESRAELVAKMGEAQVKLIEHGLAIEVANVRTKQAEAAQQVFDSINLPGFTDGKAAFDVLSEWAVSGCTEEERNTYNDMLAQGGVQANLAVKALKDKYMSDPTYSVPATLVPGTTVPAATGIEPISRSTYVTELGKAERSRDRVAAAKLRERAKHTMATNPDAWRPQ